MDWHIFQSTDKIAKDPPVKVDLVTEVHKPFSLKEVRVSTVDMFLTSTVVLKAYRVEIHAHRQSICPVPALNEPPALYIRTPLP